MQQINPRAVVQKVTLGKDDLKIKIPFSMAVAGPSQCGKSRFICKLIENRESIFAESFGRIIYCQPETLAHRPNPIFNQILKTFPRAELLSGLPVLSKLHLDLGSLQPSLIVIDDQMNAFLSSEEMVHLLTVDCHHKSISVIYSLQNYFSQSRHHGKTLMRNTNYKVLFFNRTDLTELRSISMQIVPKNANFLESCFQFLFRTFPTDESHYILVDGHFRSRVPQFFIRTHLFRDANNVTRPIIFFPK